MKRLFVIAFFVISSTCLALADSGDNAVLARSGANALLIWDATSTVAQAAHEKQPNDAELLAIENQAARILVQKAKALKGASTVTIRVIYQRTGDVSPIYGSPTFAGVERLLTVTARRKSAIAAEKQIHPGSVLPAQFKVEVSGKLPPQ